MDGVGEHSITEHARREGIYLAHLTGIRAVAAVAVCLLHVWLTVYQGPGGVSLEHPWWNGWLHSGGVGVEVFIVVSGYSLMLAPARRGGHFPEGARSWFVRRGRRILPAYWAALALGAVLGVTVLSDPSEFGYQLALPVRFWDFIGHVFLVHDVVGNVSGINYVLWSMAVEWQIYFLMPLILLAVRRGWVWPMMAAAVLGTLFVTRVNHTDVALLRSLHLVGCFAIGAGACWLGRTRPRPRLLMAAALLAALAWVAVEAASYQDIAPGVLFPQARTVVLAVATGLFLAAAPQTPRSPAVRLLGSRPLVWLGERSYSFYLLHPLVLALVWNLWLDDVFGFASTPAFLLLALVGIALTTIAAHVLYRQVEVRFQAPASRTPVVERRDLGDLGRGDVAGDAEPRRG